MVVVKTLSEAIEATAGFTTTYFPFQKKKSAYELHQGHVETIKRGKVYGNKVMIGFWYPQAILNYLDSRWTAEPSLDWDKEGCIAWAESNNIDIVLAPDYIDEISIYNTSNLDYYKELSIKIWQSERYEKHFVNKIASEKARLLCVGRLFNNTDWKYIFSWKDGITRYIEADFMHKYTKKRVVILPPIKTPDGLYYSSSYFKYTPEEKAELIKIEPTVLKSDLSGKDPVGVLADDLKAAIKDPTFVLQAANVTSDERFLGPRKKLVSLNFCIGSEGNIKYDHYAFLIK